MEGRFYQYQAKVNEKIQGLAKKFEEKEIEECSFKPTILNKSKPRTVNDFLTQMNRYDEMRKEKVRNKIEEKEKETKETQKRRKLRLCKNSLILAEKKPKNTLEKLAKAKDCPKPKEDNNPYKPTVNMRSHDLLRTKPIDKLLYEDALRRYSKSISESLKAEKLISSNSEKVLLIKFKKECSAMFKYLDTDNSGTLNYTKFTTLLYNMCFLSRSSKTINKERELALKMWTLLGGQENNYIANKNLETMLVCVMNHKDFSIPSHSYPSGLGRLIENVFCVSSAEVLKIHNFFHLLYEQRNSYKDFPSKKSSSVHTSFTETKKKTGTKHEEMLISEKNRLQEK